jgi:hypothetical protein
VLFAATEHDSVYAIDADSGVTLWQVSLLGPGETTSDARGCGQVTPEIGITATPVIDRTRGAHGVIYVVAMSKVTASGTYVQRLHALDVATGAELSGSPKDVHATYPGSGDGSAGGVLTFDPKQYEERAALLLLNGAVVTAWTSHCDIDPYTGWIMSFDADTLAQRSALNVTPNGSRGAFWMAGDGPAADAAGNFYLLDGNGTFDAVLDGGGFPVQRDYGNGFLKIATTGNVLSVADYFEMWNSVDESNADTDLGSGGSIVLPDLVDANGQTRHLAVGAGKDAHIYVVDRDAMGKWNPGGNFNYQDITGVLSGTVVSTPAYFNGTLYYAAAGDALKAFPIVAARVATAPASRSARAFTYPGATPSISASGSSNGIVWALENAGTAVLHAYDASDLTRELYNSSQAAGGRDHFGAGNKFVTPTIVNGHVYVGTGSGVAVFGALQPMMTGATITSNIAAPRVPGTAVTFTAAGSGGVAPYTFKFLITADNWTTWSVARDWSTVTTLAWTPTTTGNYQVGVWARSAGNPANVGEVAAAVSYPITAATHLTVSVQGSGTVTTTDGFIQCPVVTCSHIYAGGTTVSLQAAPATGFVFGGWSSSACSSGAVFLTADQTCGATFFPVRAGAGKPGVLSLNGSVLGDAFTYNSLTGVHASEFSDGQGHFGESRGVWPAAVQVYPADFNHDGLTDFLVYAPMSGMWSKAINDGVGGFTYYSGQWSAGWTVYIVDLNGDSRSDVFVSNPTSGQWYRCVSTGDGTGGFSYTAGQWPTGLSVYPTDFNGDGMADFFLYNAGTGRWSAAINDGLSGFIYKNGAWPAALTIVPGDFNGDGRTDLFVSNAATGAWSVATTLSTLDFAYTSDRWSAGWTFTTGDFDGDGKTDLFLYYPATGWWYEAISNGSGGFALTSLGIWSPDWQVQVTDFDGDGHSDVLLYNALSGRWYQAVNSGLGSFTYGTGLWDPGLTVMGSSPRIP